MSNAIGNQTSRIHYIGNFIHSLSRNNLQILANHVCCVNSQTGRIEYLKPYDVVYNNAATNECVDAVVKTKGNQFFIPGFIDTHTHAPQYLNCGLGLDLPLLSWLEKYTFPAETKFKDQQFAKLVYEKCVKRNLRNGSTTCVYFATIHHDASYILAQICSNLRQRAFVGKVNMDQNSPEHYREVSAKQSLEETESFIKKVLNELNDPLVQPIVTPRFVPTCSSELMKGLGQLASKYNLPIQSHVSENIGEILWVKELHPQEQSYTHVYHSHGLLNSKTLMAHGIFMNDKELDLFKQTGATISHCPASNFGIRSGCLNIRRAWEKGVKVALGTDVSGGPLPSMISAMRNAIINSTSVMCHHRDSVDTNAYLSTILEKGTNGNDSKQSVPEPLTIEEAFYLATLAGAESIGLEKQIGNFQEGKEFDALLIDLDTESTPVDSFSDVFHPELLFSEQSSSSSQNQQCQEQSKYHHLLQRLIHCGDDRNIVEIYVKGNKISL